MPFCIKFIKIRDWSLLVFRIIGFRLMPYSYWAHLLCMLHSGIVSITFDPSVCLSVLACEIYFVHQHNGTELPCGPPCSVTWQKFGLQKSHIVGCQGPGVSSKTCLPSPQTKQPNPLIQEVDYRLRLENASNLLTGTLCLSRCFSLASELHCLTNVVCLSNNGVLKPKEST